MKIGSIDNLGEPLRFNGIEPIVGVTAESAKKGEKVTLWTRLALTSDEQLFHQLANEFDSVIKGMAIINGVRANFLASLFSK